jgi:ATP-dependent DNA helicase RecQ
VALADGDALFEALRAWRKREADAQGVPAYVIFHNDTLAAIATARPTSETSLAAISGVGRSKLERYGAAVLRVVSAQG